MTLQKEKFENTSLDGWEEGSPLSTVRAGCVWWPDLAGRGERVVGLTRLAEESGRRAVSLTQSVEESGLRVVARPDRWRRAGGARWPDLAGSARDEPD
jgi:hypothetical protein